MEQIVKFIRKIICLPILFYQYLLSPVFSPCCRFYPSCSEYALMAITHHGLWRGAWLTIRRLSRCHPWSPGGYDPILIKKEKL